MIVIPIVIVVLLLLIGGFVASRRGGSNAVGGSSREAVGRSSGTSASGASSAGASSGRGPAVADRPTTGGDALGDAGGDGAADPAGMGDGEAAQLDEIEELDEAADAPRPSFRDRLGRARNQFAGYFSSVLSRNNVDDETWEELEEALIRADVGVELTNQLLLDLKETAKADGITESADLLEALKALMKERLAVADRSLRFDEGTTNVWLFVGVNGVGKTTSIGKVGRRFAGVPTVMAAGDTFRAAAAEQLETWADRTGAQFVRGEEGADPSSVVFDGIQKAAASGAELVLADTAGRLHNKSNLMDELTKVRRVAGKEPGNVTEVLLVIDATTGQNGLVQASVFTEAVDVTGVVLTKLDGSAKGGIVLAIQSQLDIPVKLVGLGESAEDLVDFDHEEFVDALFEPATAS